MDKDRIRVIRDVAALLDRMEEMGENEMGNLRYREAMSFHATTDRLRSLVDRLMNTMREDATDATVEEMQPIINWLKGV